MPLAALRIDVDAQALAGRRVDEDLVGRTDAAPDTGSGFCAVAPALVQDDHDADHTQDERPAPLNGCPTAIVTSPTAMKMPATIATRIRTADCIGLLERGFC